MLGSRGTGNWKPEDFCFIYFWLCWISVAEQVFLSLQMAGCRMLRLEQLWCMSLVALWHVGSSRIRDWTHVSCISRRILYHWAREAQTSVLVLVPQASVSCFRVWFLRLYNEKSGSNLSLSWRWTFLPSSVPVFPLFQDVLYSALELLSCFLPAALLALRTAWRFC